MHTVPIPPPPDLIDCAQLREHVDTLALALARWAYRDESKAQPEVRQAANVAVESIDAALWQLHRIRGRLVDQIRRSDDAAAARVDQLLAECRAARAARAGGEYPREDPETGAPLPAGVEGHPLGRGAGAEHEDGQR